MALEINELIATTLRNRRKKIADTISKNNAVIAELRRRGAVKMESGGRTITEMVMYGESDQFGFYTGLDPIATDAQEHTTLAEFAWKQWAVGVSISGREMMINDGAYAEAKMIVNRRNAAEKTLENRIAQSAYSDGTGSGGKEIGGLGLLNPNAAGAVVGGIDSGIYTWWDNRRIATGGVTKDNIYSFMLQMCLILSRGADKPNLVIADNSYFRAFAERAEEKQRYVDAELAKIGHRNIMFEGWLPVVPDGMDGGFAPVGMHFLNLGTLTLTMHRKRNNVVLPGAASRPINIDSNTVIIAGMGNMTINDRQRNGRLFD